MGAEVTDDPYHVLYDFCARRRGWVEIKSIDERRDECGILLSWAWDVRAFVDGELAADCTSRSIRTAAQQLCHDLKLVV